jgi:hypothetical protein
MRNATKLSKLLKALSRDPRLRKVIAQARRRSRNTLGSQVESLVNVYLALSTIASGLSKKKKARAIEEHIDLVYFLVQLGLLLKENVFDRPEVQDFFSRGVKQIYQATNASLGKVTLQRKRIRPVRAPR